MLEIVRGKWYPSIYFVDDLRTVLSIMSEDTADDKAFKGSADEYGVGYKRHLPDSLVEEVHRAVRMTRMRDACHRVKRVNLDSFMY